jgi:capsular polysaccharide biosynthesis protein
LYYIWSQVPKKEILYNELKTEVNMLYSAISPEVKRSKPITWDGIVNEKFNRLSMSSPYSTFVIKAKNWRVWGNQGAVITNNNYLFKDVSREFDDEPHSIFKQLKLKPITNISGPTAVLAASGSNVYYHWMFDILPRINLLKQSGASNNIDQFIIDYLGISYQKETLERAGIAPGKIVRSNNHWNFHVKVDDLIIPSLVSPNNTPTIEACLYLRSLFQKEIAVKSSGKKLYIQRLNGRKIINETEILNILKPLNFQVVHPEKLTVAQQAKLFTEAEFVIGPHGAGLTNIVFCQPGTRVIDLFAPEWINPCYWILADALQLKYGYLIGESTSNDIQQNKRADIKVDVDKFKTLINKVNE